MHAWPEDSEDDVYKNIFVIAGAKAEIHYTVDDIFFY